MSNDNSAENRPDPRLRVQWAGSSASIPGVRCRGCGYVAAEVLPRCPVCWAGVDSVELAPEGVVWSSTVVRVPVPGRRPPFGLAYVDLDDGPRILAHIADGEAPAPVGARVRIDGLTEAGDAEGRVLS